MTTAREEFEHLAARLADQRRMPSPSERRALRKRSGVSLREAARVVDASATAVSAWESGRYRPRGENLAGYLDLLDLLAQMDADQ